MRTLKKTQPVLLAGALCMAGMPLYAGSLGRSGDVDMAQYVSRFSRNSSIFNSSRDNVIKAANLDLQKVVSVSSSVADEEVEMAVQPVLSVGPVRSFMDLDGPDGEMWYYTTELITKDVQHPYYVEHILQAYQFDIYDSAWNHVGTVFDKMEYADDEVRVPGPDIGISLLPIVTKNFFNSTDDYEVVVSLAVNSTTPGVNHYYSRVYSIGGEKLEKTIIDTDHPEGYQRPCDVMIENVPSRVSDVLNASDEGGENFYLAFEAGYDIAYYGKADENGGMKLIHTFGVDSSYKNQGDFEYSTPMLSFFRDGKAYVLFPTYREDFFDFVKSDDSGYDDMVMHPDNFLDINLYTLDNEKANLIQTTSVPVALDTSKEDAIATYYQVGAFRWAEDVSFGTFTEDGRASFYVTRSNHLSASDSNTDYCIYVYDPDGNKIRTIFEYADRYFPLSDIDGANPMHLFTSTENGVYNYNMVDIITGEKVVIASYIDTGYDEPELLTANVDRIATGNGTYKYAFEMRVPILDEDDNTLMRVAWLNADGTTDRIDKINLGKNIEYAQCYIDNEALQPDLFKVDPAYEYMVLLKYNVTDSNEEHLLIAQACTDDNPNGEELLRLTPSEKGTLSSIALLPLYGENMLTVCYTGAAGFNTEFYKLPLEKTEVNGINSPEHDSALSYVNGVVVAPGCSITVYDIAGAAVAKAFGTFDTKDLSAGVYMVSTGKDTRKILVK